MLDRRALPLRGEGTWQSHVDCHKGSAVRVPDEIPDLIAARACINPLAAATMLRLWPVRNKTILLSAAGSSCAGHLAFWAIRQGAAQFIGIYRSETRLDHLRRSGIEPVSICDTAAIGDAAARAKTAFDALGGAVAGQILGGMRRDTEFVSYGLFTGNPVRVTAGFRAKHHRFHLRDHLPTATGCEMQNAFADIWPMLAERPPPAPKVFQARDWRQAVGEMERPGGRKPILDMPNLAAPP